MSTPGEGSGNAGAGSAASAAEAAQPSLAQVQSLLCRAARNAVLGRKTMSAELQQKAAAVAAALVATDPAHAHDTLLPVHGTLAHASSLLVASHALLEAQPRAAAPPRSASEALAARTKHLAGLATIWALVRSCFLALRARRLAGTAGAGACSAAEVATKRAEMAAVKRAARGEAALLEPGVGSWLDACASAVGVSLHLEAAVSALNAVSAMQLLFGTAVGDDGAEVEKFVIGTLDLFSSLPSTSVVPNSQDELQFNRWLPELAAQLLSPPGAAGRLLAAWDSPAVRAARARRRLPPSGEDHASYATAARRLDRRRAADEAAHGLRGWLRRAGVRRPGGYGAPVPRLLSLPRRGLLRRRVRRRGLAGGAPQGVQGGARGGGVSCAGAGGKARRCHSGCGWRILLVRSKRSATPYVGAALCCLLADSRLKLSLKLYSGARNCPGSVRRT